MSLDGFTLQFSDEWQQSPAIPGNPSIGAMLGRTPQEAMENGATFVALAPPIPNGSDASHLHRISKEANRQRIYGDRAG